MCRLKTRRRGLSRIQTAAAGEKKSGSGAPSINTPKDLEAANPTPTRAPFFCNLRNSSGTIQYELLLDGELASWVGVAIHDTGTGGGGDEGLAALTVHAAATPQ